MSNHWSFVGGDRGVRKVTQMRAFRGAPLEAVERIEIINGLPQKRDEGTVESPRLYQQRPLRHGRRDQNPQLQLEYLSLATTGMRD